MFLECYVLMLFRLFHKGGLPSLHSGDAKAMAQNQRASNNGNVG